MTGTYCCKKGGISFPLGDQTSRNLAKLGVCIPDGSECEDPRSRFCVIDTTNSGGNQCCTASDCGSSDHGAYCCRKKDGTDYQNFLSCSNEPCDCEEETD